MRKQAPLVPHRQLVTFRVGVDEFGVDVFSVHEIVRWEPVTPVPRAPAFVEGVLDIRGALVPVVDLRRRFELPQAPTDAATRIVVVEFRGERLGLVVGEVTEVARVPETAFAPPPDYVRGLAAEYLESIVQLPERLIVVLDVDRILSSTERIQLQQMETETEVPEVGENGAAASGAQRGAAERAETQEG